MSIDGNLIPLFAISVGLIISVATIISKHRLQVERIRADAMVRAEEVRSRNQFELEKLMRQDKENAGSNPAHGYDRTNAGGYPPSGYEQADMDGNPAKGFEKTDTASNPPDRGAASHYEEDLKTRNRVRE